MASINHALICAVVAVVSFAAPGKRHVYPPHLPVLLAMHMLLSVTY